MNLLAWIIALSLVIFLMIEAVTFHKATVCRQKAWLKSTEILTRSTLSGAKENDREWDLTCRLEVRKIEHQITWRLFPLGKENSFDVTLKGKL